MTNTHWFILIGCLLLARGLSSTLLSRQHFTSAIFYLAAGIVLGPMVFNLFRFDSIRQASVLEVLTEVAVLISLFSAGVKMPVPVRLKRWAPALRLAWVSMALAVGMVAAFAHYVLELSWGAAVLLGAILAPTDPVLATDVQSRHAGDRDHLRFNLTCEAGLNDGTAFPFVMLGLGLLGLHELGDFGTRWVLVEVLWATAAAIAIGALGGVGMAHLSWKLRSGEQRHEILDDLVGLGLIAVLYGVSVMVDAWGFLTVFCAGVALRQTEVKLSRRASPPAASSDAGVDDDEDKPAIVSAESLIFEEHLERLSELLLVLLLGGMLLTSFWTWQAVGLAAFVFFIARPASVLLGLAGSTQSWQVRGMIAWFGVRGIGSLYYLMFAIVHGLPKDLAAQLTQLTFVVITLSIVLHGSTVKALMEWYEGPAEDAAVPAARD
ncbi:MAG TPA: cation:proton antiporter [Burkholderiaceae bacterium]